MKKYGLMKSSPLLLFILITGVFTQTSNGKGYSFTLIKEVKTTPVKDQNLTGTCWSFATVSFIESELIRKGKGEFDLSEMFNVRKVYAEKAEKYMRYHGNISMVGGQAHDAMNVVRDYGIVPEAAYTGLNIGGEGHNHNELDAVMEGILQAVVSNKGKQLTPRWKEAFESVLDVYLGTPPGAIYLQRKNIYPGDICQ